MRNKDRAFIASDAGVGGPVQECTRSAVAGISASASRQNRKRLFKLWSKNLFRGFTEGSVVRTDYQAFLSPDRNSVPARRRAILARCVQKTRMAKSVVVPIKGHAPFQLGAKL